MSEKSQSCIHTGGYTKAIFRGKLSSACILVDSCAPGLIMSIHSWSTSRATAGEKVSRVSSITQANPSHDANTVKIDSDHMFGKNKQTALTSAAHCLWNASSLVTLGRMQALNSMCLTKTLLKHFTRSICICSPPFFGRGRSEPGTSS